jgi:hypothetical protein
MQTRCTLERRPNLRKRSVGRPQTRWSNHLHRTAVQELDVNSRRFWRGLCPAVDCGGLMMMMMSSTLKPAILKPKLLLVNILYLCSLLVSLFLVFIFGFRIDCECEKEMSIRWRPLFPMPYWSINIKSMNDLLNWLFWLTRVLYKNVSSCSRPITKI